MNSNGGFEEFQALANEIEQSEGERIFREIRSMQASLGLVGRNYKELVQTLESFQEEKATLMLHDITKKDALHEAFEIIQTRLHNFLAAAFSLVEHMRRHRNHLYADHEFDKKIGEELRRRILGRPHHKLAQGLRNYCLHLSLPPIASRVRIGRDHADAPLQFSESVFHIPSDALLSWDGWKPEARAELRRMPDGIALLPFATEYFQQIECFYTWLWGRQGDLHKAQLDATNALRDKARSMYKELYPGDPRV
jgi:hypothetical protein